MLVNACYWGLGMEDNMPAKANVDVVGKYDPNPIGTRGHKPGRKPSDHKID